MSYDLENLSMQNLLALALRDNSVKELAEKYHTPRSLHHASLDDLTEIKGIGQKKALQLMAILELSRRIVSSPPNANPVITNPAEIVSLVKDKMKLLDREYFVTFLLDTKNKVLTSEVVSIGSLNNSIVNPREVYKKAIKLSAASIILCHNHPSGDSTPSGEDISVTRRLVEAGEIIGINILDHIIIGDGRFDSLRERGVI